MEVIKEVINQSFGKLRIDPEQGRMGQNFEGVKNDLFVERERERDCFYLVRKNQAPNLSLEASAKWDLSVFEFNIQFGKSDAIFAADFLFQLK